MKEISGLCMCTNHRCTCIHTHNDIQKRKYEMRKLYLVYKVCGLSTEKCYPVASSISTNCPNGNLCSSV